MTPTLVFLFLTGIAFLLMALEVFVPGGIIGTIGGLSLLAACVYAIKAFGVANGILVSFFLVLLTLGGFMYWLIRLPDSRIGKKFALSSDLHHAKSASDEDTLVGKVGVAETDLRPSGYARISGKRVDVLAAHGFIAKDTPIEVTEVHGMRVVVKPISPGVSA